MRFLMMTLVTMERWKRDKQINDRSRPADEFLYRGDSKKYKKKYQTTSPSALGVRFYSSQI